MVLFKGDDLEVLVITATKVTLDDPRRTSSGAIDTDPVAGHAKGALVNVVDVWICEVELEPNTLRTGSRIARERDAVKVLLGILPYAVVRRGVAEQEHD